MMTSYTENLSIEGLDDDDEATDDEVFTRGGKLIPLEENGVNKPLMARRANAKNDFLHTKIRKVPSLRVLWAPILYTLFAFGAIIGIICLIIFLISVLLSYLGRDVQMEFFYQPSVMPCLKVTVEDVWAQTFPRLTTETAIRLNDINLDGVDDIILGFGTGADAFHYPDVVCEVYFHHTKVCGGGLLALDGLTGNEIWRYYTPHEIFAVNCNVDIDGDHILDCLGGGRMAGLVAVSGANGKPLWIFDDPVALIETSNVYTPQYIRDLDNDGIPDLIVIHGGDPMKEPGSKERLIGRILVMSSRTGKVLHWVEVPDGRESYYSPQILVYPDGREMVLFGTGGETHGGSLYCISIPDLLKGNIEKAYEIYRDVNKGIMTPPVLVDMNKDGVVDIVMAMFNSSVIAFDGVTFQKLWTQNFPSSESYSTPGVGFFNNDTIPDFIVNYQVGPGFPVYYLTKTTILDGRNGNPLLNKPVEMLVGTQSSPLAISVEGYGNDIFLYWVSDCHGDKGKGNQEFEFLEGTSIHEQSRANFCKLRFKENLFSRLYAMNNHTGTPGVLVYDSDARKDVEYSNNLNYTAIGLAYLQEHPEYLEQYEKYLRRIEDAKRQKSDYDIPFDMSLYPNYFNGYGQLKDGAAYGNAKKAEAFTSFDRNIQKKEMGDKWGFLKYYQSQSSPSNLRSRDDNAYLSSLKLKIQNNGRLTKPLKNDRKKRHVGPHDAGGIQRIISTGTLIPPFSNVDANHAIDVVFATFWFYAARTQVLFPEDKKCIEDRLMGEQERFSLNSQYYGFDHDAYEEAIIDECLEKSGHLSDSEDPASGEGYNPFNHPMGQMTVYRMRIKCSCTDEQKASNSGMRCAKILPFDQQGWTSYMGRQGNSLYHPRAQF